MKKIYRRFSAMIMCVPLLLLLASAASAASVSWSDSEGGKTLTLTLSEWFYHRVAVTNPRRYYHIRGTETDLSNYGDFSASVGSWYDETNYPSKLVQAMRLEGLYTSYTANETFNSPLAVPADDPTGYYTLGVLFDMRGGSWEVVHGMLFIPDSIAVVKPVKFETGKLHYAPAGTIHGYVVMPVP